MVLYPNFQALDIFGPLDALNLLSLAYPLNLSIIAASRDPVSTKPRYPGMLKVNSTFGESVVPTHTFDDAPPLDVLMVPGGTGSRAPDLNSTIEFIARTYPTVQYLITICSGSALVSKSGLLDGKKATTNKAAYKSLTPWRPQVNWIPQARWVVDGNIWTSSGVSAGIDAILAFIEQVYGSEAARTVTNYMEYDRHTDASWDPFAELWNLTSA